MPTSLASVENALKPLFPTFEQVARPLRRYGVDPGRIMRSVLISFDRTPKLLECDLPSILQAATTGAILGLEADGVTGQGFLIPFNRKGHGKRAQWVTGYLGYNTLAGRAGLTLNGEVVRKDDIFDYEEGSNGYVKHKKLLNQPNREVVAAWATATATGRPAIVKVLDRDDIDAVRARSRAARNDDDGEETYSPWNEPKIGFPAMAAKTAKRRLRRDLPMLTMDQTFYQAAIIDETHEERGLPAYLHPDRGIVIDGERTAAPLVPDAQPGPVTGPTVGQIKAKRFVITGGHDDLVLPTIEQWRSRWMTMIADLKPAAAEKLYDRNAVLFDDYSVEHRAAVKDVIEALQRKYR